jgi:NADPH:quinone reductase-like Zn-dependent oxidoreductase
MRAAVIDGYGGNDRVQLREMPRPEPGDTDVLIEIHAASVNPVDFKIREGKVKLLLPYSFPLILGCDLAGVVVEIGSKVRKFKKGDAVYARVGKMRIGTFAEFIAVSESEVSLKPESLSMIEAASIPLVGLTSWQALFEKGGLKPAGRVLIHAGSGGVGSFAIQLARGFGAWVATTTSTDNVEWVKKLGASQVIDYRKEHFEERLSGMDVVFDTLGGETLKKSFLITREGGTVVSIAGMPDYKFARERHLGRKLQLIFAIASFKIHSIARRARVKYEYLFMNPSGAQLDQIRAMIESGKIHPVIDRVFPLEQVKDALAYVEAGHSKGKVVVQIRE